MYSDDENFLTDDGYIFNQKLSWSKKKANNFKWAEKCALYIDQLYSCYGDKKRLQRLQMNYDLANGHGSSAMAYYAQEGFDELMEEGIGGDYRDIPHHPVIQQIFNAMVGEQQLRSVKPIAFDNSKYSLNDRKRKKLELLQSSIKERIIAPIEQQVTQQWMQENGIQDPYSMTPQQNQQAQSDIAERTKAMTPKEIHEYMRKDYKSPSETQAQKIMDFAMDYLDIKHVTDEGFKHGLITGEEIYRVGVRHNKPFIELIDPMGFFYMGRPNSMFIEDGVIWKNEQYVMYNDIYQWHGDEIGNSKSLQEKLASYAIGGSRNRKGGEPLPQLVAEVSRGNEYIVDASPDIRKKEGQEYLKRIFSEFTGGVNKGGDIRYTHCAWKSLRKLKNITRYNRKTDDIKSIWIDESYTFNPGKIDKEGYQDIKESIAWVPETWQTTIVGQDLTFQKEPIPYQYRSLNDPWSCKGPYVGAMYNKLMNNTPNVSPIDMGKPWQYKFNIQMAKIHELEATDMGKIMLTSFNAKPKDWSWKKYLLMAKYGKILPVDLQQEGVTPMDAQVFKGIDLSTIDRLAGQLQYLEFLRNQIALSMSYNPSRLGQQGPMVAVTNNQQNIMQSSYQTNNVYNIHNKIVENLCNYVLDATRIAFKENKELCGYVLDDMSQAELDVDIEMLDRSELNVKVRNSSEDFENLRQIKQLAQPMVQNGLISFSELIRLQFSKNGAEILNLAESAEERRRADMAEQQKVQEQMLQQQSEMQKQLQEQQQQFELLKQDKELNVRIQESMIESERFAKQKDIDNNKVNDDLQKTQLEHSLKLKEMELEHIHKMLELNSKDKEMSKKMELEREKLTKEIQIKEKELEIKKIQARKPSSTSK